MASSDNKSRRLNSERDGSRQTRSPSGDHIYSKDVTTMTKRKKDEENIKEGNVPITKRTCETNRGMAHTWLQTPSTVTIELNLTSYKSQDLKKISSNITDTAVCVSLPDGRKWSCNLSAEIKREDSKVVVDGGKIRITLYKQQPLQWPSLEKQKVLAETCTNEQTECVKEVTESSIYPLNHTKHDYIEHSVSKNLKEVTECSIYHLNHTKHDYIEHEKKLTLKVFVNAIEGSTHVEFGPQSLTVLFKTKEPLYLKLHSRTTKHTTFSWSLNLKGEISPQQCTFTWSLSHITVELCKVSSTRWGSLEASSVKPLATTKTNPPFGELGCAGDSIMGQEKMDPEKERREEGDAGANKEAVISKPTCMVSPLNKLGPDPIPQREVVVQRGFTGLDNLGNTCFMNSVLQALVNTREFRDYFLGSHYQKDLNTNNPLGSGGRLAVEFALLNKYLWAGIHYSYAPSKLKTLVAMKASQFTGYAQHDAQEFMAFLLDGLHEDLNRVKQKPYIPTTIETDGRADTIVADESWDLYKKRNDSFVVDLFQGQYKSKLVCPVCSKVSITFDPFLYLQVPLPKKRRLFPVIFMSKDPSQKPVKMMLRLPKEAGVDELKDLMSRKTGVRSTDMRIFEAYKGKIHKVFGRNSDISTVQLTDNIFVCEVLSEDVAGETVFEIAVIQRTVMPTDAPASCASCKKQCGSHKLKRCTKCYKVAYCDQACQKAHWSSHKSMCANTPAPVGCPFVISLPESKATYSRLCQLMEAFARYSVDVFQPPVKTEKSTKMSSELSSCSLSSSHSRGSQSSLDSQSSSASSTCTLTAENDHRRLSEEEHFEDPVAESEETEPEPPVDPTISSPDRLPHLTSDGEGHVTRGRLSPSRPQTTDILDGIQFIDSDTNNGNKSQITTASHDILTDVDRLDAVNGNGNGILSNSVDKTNITKSDAGFKKPIPTNVVIGISQNEVVEKCMPTYYIRPVSQMGDTVAGNTGSTLLDKGDEPLDLSSIQFLSMDWKNSERLTPYILVQSKALECRQDSSMQTEYVEENGPMKLRQCLTLFSEPEILSPDEAWYCPQCKEHREATKQMSVWRLPPTLIIQLKRFSFRNFIWRDKIDKFVEFPTRGLNLMDYYVGPRLTGEEPIYDLYAVINHHGGILGGHYTAYVRCPNTDDPCSNDVGWRLCDDSRVSKCNESDVVGNAAYVLFYRQRRLHLPVPDHIKLEEGETIQQSTSIATATVVKADVSHTRPLAATATAESLSDNEVYTDMDAID